MCTVARVWVVACVPDRMHVWLHTRKRVVLPRVCVCARFAHACVVAGALCAWLHGCAVVQTLSCSQLHGCAGFQTWSVAPTCVVSHVQSCVHARAGACRRGCTPIQLHMHACLRTHPVAYKQSVHGCTYALLHMRVWFHPCTAARMHSCTCTVAHACVFARMHGCVHAELHTYTVARRAAGVWGCTCVHACTQPCTCAQLQACTVAHTHSMVLARVCTVAHACAQAPPPPALLPPAFCSSCRQRLREEPPDLRPWALHPPSGWLHLPLPPWLLAQHPGHPLHW